MYCEYPRATFLFIEPRTTIIASLERPSFLPDLSSTMSLRDEFGRVCGSPLWVEETLNQMPYNNLDHLIEEAVRIWWSLPIEEWQLAFAA